MLLDLLAGLDPSILRFEALVGHFSTYSVVAVGLAGDYNQNGTVDAADYTVWRDHLGSGTSLPNDNSPGVGQDDYTRWKINFGQSAGGGAGAASANTSVPEPSLLALLCLGLAGLSMIADRIRHD